jgi:type VI secretion system protein ImpA
MAVAIKGAMDDAAAIESAVTEQVGVQRAVSLDGLSDILRRMSRLMDEQVERLGLGQAAEEAADESGDVTADGDGEGLPADLDSGYDAAVAAKPAFDEVRTREDVIRLLDKICDYYHDHEPSSPIPLLLRRAKRVATMDFLELLRELAPGGLPEAEVLKGSAEAESGS